MFLEEFIKIYEPIINEFRILNEHFDSKDKSKTADYDIIFSSWVKDMSRRFRTIVLSMHWATSSTQIAKNQILFDTRYKDEYFCELKYNFSPSFVSQFSTNLKEYLNSFSQIVSKFNKLNSDIDLNKITTTKDYDSMFLEWKKNVSKDFTNAVLDIYWDNKNESLFRNPLNLTLMFKDDFLCEVKYKFIDENAMKSPAFLDEVFDPDRI